MMIVILLFTGFSYISKARGVKITELIVSKFEEFNCNKSLGIFPGVYSLTVGQEVIENGKLKESFEQKPSYEILVHANEEELIFRPFTKPYLFSIESNNKKQEKEEWKGFFRNEDGKCIISTPFFVLELKSYSFQDIHHSEFIFEVLEEIEEPGADNKNTNVVKWIFKKKKMLRRKYHDLLGNHIF